MCVRAIRRLIGASGLAIGVDGAVGRRDFARRLAGVGNPVRSRMVRRVGRRVLVIVGGLRSGSVVVVSFVSRLGRKPASFLSVVPCRRPRRWRMRAVAVRRRDDNPLARLSAHCRPIAMMALMPRVRWPRPLATVMIDMDYAADLDVVLMDDVLRHSRAGPKGTGQSRVPEDIVDGYGTADAV